MSSISAAHLMASATRQAHQSVRFSGIYANYNSDTFNAYQRAFTTQPQEHLLKTNATRIFRELPAISAITQLIGKTQPADIHILGCSDGSEAFAQAISIHQRYGAEAAKRVTITGVDRDAGLVALAKTGHLVCTDLEREWSNDAVRCQGHPLQGAGWDTYLKKTSSAPTNFDDITRQHPSLAQITRDPVAGITIGKGMHWYEVANKDLPPVDFQANSMETYQAKPSSPDHQQVYVLSNALAYVAQQQGAEAFLGVFDRIKTQNAGKSPLIVLGDIEHQVFRQAPMLASVIQAMGIAPMSKEELRKAGVQQVDKVYGDIWKVNPNTPTVKFVFS